MDLYIIFYLQFFIGFTHHFSINVRTKYTNKPYNVVRCKIRAFYSILQKEAWSKHTMEENTLNKVKLNQEVKIKKIDASRKYKKKNTRFRYDRRNENKASIKKSTWRPNCIWGKRKFNFVKGGRSKKNLYYIKKHGYYNNFVIGVLFLCFLHTNKVEEKIGGMLWD